MPKFTATTTIDTGAEKISASTTGDYVELFRVKQTVDNTDGFISIATGSSTKSAAKSVTNSGSEHSSMVHAHTSSQQGI